jgi:hypothetical protein
MTYLQGSGCIKSAFKVDKMHFGCKMLNTVWMICIIQEVVKVMSQRVAHILLVIVTLMVLDRADVYNLVAHSLGTKDEAHQTLSAAEAIMAERKSGGTKSKLFKSKIVLRPTKCVIKKGLQKSYSFVDVFKFHSHKTYHTYKVDVLNMAESICNFCLLVPIF